MKNLVLLVALMFSFVMVYSQSEPQTMGPEIDFKKTTHDYGTIELNGDGTYRFEFTNTGNEPLILSKPRSSCGCTVPSWPKESCQVKPMKLRLHITHIKLVLLIKPLLFIQMPKTNPLYCFE